MPTAHQGGSPGQRRCPQARSPWWSRSARHCPVGPAGLPPSAGPRLAAQRPRPPEPAPCEAPSPPPLGAPVLSEQPGSQARPEQRPVGAGTLRQSQDTAARPGGAAVLGAQGGSEPGGRWPAPCWPGAWRPNTSYSVRPGRGRLPGCSRAEPVGEEAAGLGWQQVRFMHKGAQTERPEGQGCALETPPREPPPCPSDDSEQTPQRVPGPHVE